MRTWNWNPRMEQIRPENIPPQKRTLQEQAGLNYEEIHRRTPPVAFYVITQIIYSYFGVQADYFHFSLCTEHQLYQYRHQPSDQFLRTSSFCYDCHACPHKIIEHAHPPGNPCNIKCDNRVVFRPGKELIRICGHNCLSHIEPFPTFFSRQLIPEYPKNMPFSPFFQRREEFRHSTKLAKKTSQPAEKVVKQAEERKRLIIRFQPCIEPEDFLCLFTE